MNFKTMKKTMKANFDKMINGHNTLFEVGVDKDVMWNLYLDSFPKGTNDIFRERREHDCSCCRSFVRNFGNVVVIDNGVMSTIWDFENKEYQVVLDILSNFVKAHAIENVHIAKFGKIGTDFNFETINGSSHRWEHYHLELPSRLVDKSSKSIGDIQGDVRSSKDVFKRSLVELTKESIISVLELITENTLYKGEEWKVQLETFLKHKQVFQALPVEDQDLYVWENVSKVNGALARIRNTSIGTLLINLSEGMDLETSVKKYEVVVAPSNYKRPKPIFTKHMLEKAKKTVMDLGYEGSLARRHATIQDITVNNILFANRNIVKSVGNALDIFGEMEKEVAVNVKNFDRAKEITIEEFLKNILPSATGLEVLLENRHENSLQSLIAPQDISAKNMFKWDNPFGWAYNGNITDSTLREQVISKGGRVDGVLRMSSSWNHEGKRNESLMDFHVFFPTNKHNELKDRNGVEVHDNYGSTDRVGWNHRNEYSTGGTQDVDYTSQAPQGHIPVENITFPSLEKMPNGIYTFKAHNWKYRKSANGFKCEIEFNGEILEFDYNKEMINKEWITIAKIELKDGQWKVIEKLESKSTPKKIWNLNTNNFHPVSVMMFSPNYWNEQEGVGNRHYFFMLKDCQNDQSPNGFFNEYLKQDLHDHRKVFEALGSKMRVEHVADQLSGLGFSSTKRAEVIVKVDGKVMKIKF